MKRWLLLIALVCLACLARPDRIVAQETGQPTPAATATSDPLVWDDQAMHLVVPSDFVLLRRVPSVSLDQLSDDPQVVAQWLPSKPPLRKLSLSMAANTGDLDSWEETFVQSMRDKYDDLLTGDKTRISLKNGMPAYFESFTFGSGFSEEKEYAVIWADGQRGIALALDAQIDQVTEAQAKAALSDITAVAYPIDQP